MESVYRKASTYTESCGQESVAAKLNEKEPQCSGGSRPRVWSEFLR